MQMTSCIIDEMFQCLKQGRSLHFFYCICESESSKALKPSQQIPSFWVCRAEFKTKYGVHCCTRDSVKSLAVVAQLCPFQRCGWLMEKKEEMCHRHLSRCLCWGHTLMKRRYNFTSNHRIFKKKKHLHKLVCSLIYVCRLRVCKLEFRLMTVCV